MITVRMYGGELVAARGAAESMGLTLSQLVRKLLARVSGYTPEHNAPDHMPQAPAKREPAPRPKLVSSPPVPEEVLESHPQPEPAKDDQALRPLAYEPRKAFPKPKAGR